MSVEGVWGFVPEGKRRGKGQPDEIDRTPVVRRCCKRWKRRQLCSAFSCPYLMSMRSVMRSAGCITHDSPPIHLSQLWTAVAVRYYC